MLSLNEIKTIAIGSKNPVKLNAVKFAFEKLWRSDLFIISVDEPAMRGISHQPLSKEEALQGAKNRADYCFEMHPEIDIAFGVEGGVFFNEKKDKCFLFGVVYARDKDGYENFSYTWDALLPNVVRDRLLAGEELGPVMNQILHKDDIGKTLWTFWVLSNGVIQRTESFMINTVSTLVPRINKERGWY